MAYEGRKKRNVPLGGKDVQRDLTLKVDNALMEKTRRYGIDLFKFHYYALDNALKKVFENHIEIVRVYWSRFDRGFKGGTQVEGSGIT